MLPFSPRLINDVTDLLDQKQYLQGGVQDGGHPWLIRVDVWWQPLQYCKVISLQLKLIN